MVWFVWGTTYVAIAESLEGLPPFLIAAARFGVAAILLMGWARRRGASWPTRPQWLAAAASGVALIAIGDGGVIWASLYLPSGQVAVLVSLTPLFMLLLLRNWSPMAVLASVCGLAGALCVGASGGQGVLHSGGVPLRSAAICVGVVAAAAWAWASLSDRQRGLPDSLAMAVGLQLLWGGAGLALLGAACGEWHQLRLEPLLGRPGLAIVYLTLFSCVLGFSSYAWLIRNAGPALVGSFAYVNPVVALWAGYVVRLEPLGLWVGVGTVCVLAAVGLARVAEQTNTTSCPAVYNDHTQES